VTVDQALELIDRAERAEEDAALHTLFAMTGTRVPESLGSLRNRLELIIMATTLGETAGVLREMGDSFAEAGIVWTRLNGSGPMALDA
jgi:hypothetical protein